MTVHSIVYSLKKIPEGTKNKIETPTTNEKIHIIPLISEDFFIASFSPFIKYLRLFKYLRLHWQL